MADTHLDAPTIQTAIAALEHQANQLERTAATLRSTATLLRVHAKLDDELLADAQRMSTWINDLGELGGD
jgi:hypothetical protein